MNTLHDDIIGDLSYEYGWIRRYCVPSFGVPVDVQLIIPCDEGDDIENVQRAAFVKFESNKALYLRQAEIAIFNYYQDVCGECRVRFGEEYADKLAPVIDCDEQIKELVKLNQVIIQQSFDSGERIVGLLYSCSWEPELGLAVKFVNELIDEVGTQDIVL